MAKQNDAKVQAVKMVTVYNKGSRTWTPKTVNGLSIELTPNGAAEMPELEGTQFALAYPKDITLTKQSAPSTADLARREQSVRDKETNLKSWEANLKSREDEIISREKALDEREATLIEREANLDKT